MNIYLNIALHVYFGINLILLGAWLSSTDYSGSKKVVYTVPILMLALPVLIASFVLPPMWELINRYTGINFWWQYWFTKKWHNVPTDHLEYLNNLPDLKKNNIVAALMRYCVKLVNKRNNYTPDKQPELTTPPINTF